MTPPLLDHEKAQLALDFLKQFYLSDISDDLKKRAKEIVSEYFGQPPPERECKEGECCGKIQACICDCHQPPSPAKGPDGCCDVCINWARDIGKGCSHSCHNSETAKCTYNPPFINSCKCPEHTPAPSAVEAKIQELSDEYRGVAFYDETPKMPFALDFMNELRELADLARKEGK